jgi:hypothetical protein
MRREIQPLSRLGAFAKSPRRVILIIEEDHARERSGLGCHSARSIGGPPVVTHRTRHLGRCNGRADRNVAQEKDSGSGAARICHPSVPINAGRIGLGSQRTSRTPPDPCSKNLSIPSSTVCRTRNLAGGIACCGVDILHPLGTRPPGGPSLQPDMRSSYPTESSSDACINSQTSREFSGKVRQRLMQPPRIYLTTALHAWPCIEIEQWALGPRFPPNLRASKDLRTWGSPSFPDRGTIGPAT